MSARSRRMPRGFTIVELLVVIAIIAVLIGLLIPAVQAARESARKTVCSSNQRQIGLALHAYLAVKKALPPGYVSKVREDLEDGGPGWAWGAKILPFCEQTALHELTDYNILITSRAADQFRLLSVPIFRCPSDSELHDVIDIPQKFTDRVMCQMASANYVGSVGTVRATCKICRDLFDGVFGRNRAIRAADITDGLSNTLAVGERASQWANAAMWGVVPNSKLPDHQQADRYAAGPAYVLGTTFADGFNIEEAEMDDHNEAVSYAESFGSFHRGGANFAFCDGGVRFVYDNVDPRVMNALATRDGTAKGGGLADPIIHDSPF